MKRCIFPFVSILTYLLFFFFCSVISSSAGKPDVPDCVPLLCQGEYFLSDEDCTKGGCRGKSCLHSFAEAFYGASCPRLPRHNPIDSGEMKTNFGYTGLIWSPALAWWTLLTWLWIGVKDVVLILWVLTLLGVVMLAVWRSLNSFLDGVEGPGLVPWLLVLVWLGVLTVWTLLTYFWVELFKINLVLWGLTLLHCGIDGARLHLR